MRQNLIFYNFVLDLHVLAFDRYSTKSKITTTCYNAVAIAQADDIMTHTIELFVHPFIKHL